MEKLNQYEGWLGRLHGYRNFLREKWQSSDDNIFKKIFKNVIKTSENEPNEATDYSHIYR